MSYNATQFISYQEYLKTHWWKELRSHALWHFDYRCQLCGREKAECELHVHHIRRDNLGSEKPWEVTVLCDRCHQAVEEMLIVGAA